MSPTTRLRVALFCTILALVLLAAGLIGMLQSPRPAWSRGLAIPALVLILVSRSIRRWAQRDLTPGDPGAG